MNKAIVRLLSLVFILLIFTSTFVPLLPTIPKASANTGTIKVTSSWDHNPSYHWCQHTDGSWSTWSEIDGWRYADDDNGQPALTRVKNFTILSPPTENWRDEYSNKYLPSKVLNKRVVEVVPHPQADPNLQTVIDPLDEKAKETGLVTLTAFTGQGVPGIEDWEICGGNRGYIYWIPVQAIWEGEVEPDEFLGLEINPEHKSLSVGETQQFTVTAVWKQDGEIRRYPVENYRLSWSSSQPARASVSSSGLVRGLQETTTDATITATFSERNASVSATVKVLRSETPVYIITGDFDILPSDTIEYRDSFALKPKDIVIPNECAYHYHEYKIERSGLTWIGGKTTGQTAPLSYSYGDYPYVIAIGGHDVSIRITATCPTGTLDSGWIANKLLTVEGPAGNNPPVFRIGWTTPGQWRADAVQTKVIVGTRLDLVLLDDPEPYDPDGDWVMFMGFDFSSSGSWMQQLPNRHTQYTNGFHNVLMDTEGDFCAIGIAQDTFGLRATHRACVEVVPPNPIPVIDGPSEVKEGRTLPKPFSSAQSYSPIGRAIDHSRDEWLNLKETYSSPGIEVIQLHVYDMQGLKSAQPATHTLTVTPDLPPIAELDAPDKALRNAPVVITNKSRSDDGDVIVETILSYQYDSDNDGNFDAHTERIVALDESGRYFFNPEQVGKYRFKLYVEEDFGKSATLFHVIDVVNESPFATFAVNGENPVPHMYGDTYSITADNLLSSSWINTMGAKRWIKNPNDHAIQTVNNTNGIDWKGPGDQITTNAISAPYSYHDSRYFSGGSYILEYYPDGDYPLMNGYYMRIESEKYGKTIRVYNSNDALIRTIPEISIGSINRERQLVYYQTIPQDFVITFSQLVNGEQPLSMNISSGIWHCVSSCWIPAPNYITGDHLWPFNHDYKMIVTFLKPYAYFKNDGVFELPFEDPYQVFRGRSYLNESLIKTFEEDLPYGVWYQLANQYSALNLATHPSDGFLGHDLKGHVYYKGYLDYTRVRKFSNHTGSGSYFDPVVVKLDGNTGNLVRVFHDGLGEYYFSESGTGVMSSEIKGFASDYTAERIAYLVRRYGAGNDEVIIRHSSSGSKIATVSLSGRNNVILGSYRDLFFVRHSSSQQISAYRFSNGSRAWQTSNPGGIQQGTFTTSGYYYFIEQNLLKSLNLVTGEQTVLADLTEYGGYGSDVQVNPYIKDGSLLVELGHGNFVHVEGTVQNDVDARPAFGQFTTTSIPEQDNFMLSYKQKKNTGYKFLAEDSVSFGFSFRMQDEQNTYRVERRQHGIALTKIMDGTKTELGFYKRTLTPGEWENVAVHAMVDRIKVFLDNSPVIEVTDSAFSKGKFGPYSEVPQAAFVDIALTEVTISSESSANIALVGMGVTYDTSYSDPENDPRIGQLDRWTYRHENPNKFLNAGDGKSGISMHHNQTYQGQPQRTLEKVGVYRIELQAADDPHPDYRYPDNTFSEYRERSLAHSQYLVVHRPPVAQFILSIDPSNNNVIWDDTSYDPDRWLSPTNYSTEATGIDYRTTRGIIERKYYYITPSGQTVQHKLVTPQETGVYLVGLAVKDEYGAWSQWAEQAITVAAVAPPNAPPEAGFTVTPSSGHRGTLFTIKSTASDPEDGPAANLEHAYFIRNVTEGGIETLQSTSRGTWTKPFSSLGVMEIRQVVTDSKGATAQFTRQVTVTNRAPAAQFSWSPQPVWEGDLVTFHNASADPDGDPLTHLWQIRSATGQLLHLATDAGITYRFGNPGIHPVTLQVSDGMAAHQTTRTVQVLPLTLEADVAHTPEWLAYHEERGNRTADAPKQFYSGEWMVLSARHAAAPVDWIAAGLNATGLDGQPLHVETMLSASVEAGRYEGVLYDERFSSLTAGLPKGMHDIVFRIRYANGVEKTATVPIEIIGHALGTVQVHRLR